MSFVEEHCILVPLTRDILEIVGDLNTKSNRIEPSECMIGFKSNTEPITGEAARAMLKEIEKVRSCPKQQRVRKSLPTDYTLVEA